MSLRLTMSFVLPPVLGLLVLCQAEAEQQSGGRSGRAPGSLNSGRKRPTKAYYDDPRLQATVLLQPQHEPYEPQDPHREPMALAHIGADQWSNLAQPGVLDPIRVIRGEIVKAEAVAKALTEETAVPLKLQSEWRIAWVVLSRRARPGREFMDVLAAAFGGSWHRVRETWVLAESPAIARITALSEAEFTAAVLPTYRRLFQSITPAQWQRLAADELIPFHQLTSVQARLITEIILMNRYGPYPMLRPPTSAAMRGGGVFLALAGEGTQTTLDLGVPEVQRPGITAPVPRISISFTGNNGELAWGVAPPR